MGISQLYEYRYIQDVPSAKLVLIIERPLERPLSWMARYLAEDREVLLVWDGDMRTFHCPRVIESEVRFLL